MYPWHMICLFIWFYDDLFKLKNNFLGLIISSFFEEIIACLFWIIYVWFYIAATISLKVINQGKVNVNA